ncbi:hypothetical protein KC723_01815 [Candidatus Kaiserbacteria bacterium]|nr:hypothetical protein [Candidatus Kaiserbacteria bacterium]
MFKKIISIFCITLLLIPATTNADADVVVIKEQLMAIDISVNELKAKVEELYPDSIYEAQMKLLSEAVSLVKQLSGIDFSGSDEYSINTKSDGPTYVGADDGKPTYVSDSKTAVYTNESGVSFYASDTSIAGVYGAGVGSVSTNKKSLINGFGRGSSTINKIDIYPSSAGSLFSAGSGKSTIDIKTDQGEWLKLWSRQGTSKTSEFVLGYELGKENKKKPGTMIVEESDDTEGYKIEYADIVAYLQQVIPDTDTKAKPGDFAELVFGIEPSVSVDAIGTSVGSTLFGDCTGTSTDMDIALPVVRALLNSDKIQFEKPLKDILKVHSDGNDCLFILP